MGPDRSQPPPSTPPTSVRAAPPVNFHLELPIGPEWQNVDLLRLAILNCLAAVFGDQDLSESVGIVTSELLENAIKYGEWSKRGAMRFLTLSVRGTGHEVRVEVASPITDASAHLANIKKTLDWIGRFPSAREAYIARMQMIAEAPERTGESKMGLVRIAYEGPCTIEASVESGALHVRAAIPTLDRGAMI
jgi:hypothetical protein